MLFLNMLDLQIKTTIFESITISMAPQLHTAQASGLPKNFLNMPGG